MQFEQVLFIVQYPIKIHVHKLFNQQYKTISLPITKYNNAITNIEDEIFYIVYYIVLCNFFLQFIWASEKWEKNYNLKKNIMLHFVVVLSFQIFPLFYDKH